MLDITPRDNPCYCINFRRAANTLTKFYDKALSPLNLTSSQFSLLNDIHMLKVCNKTELAQHAKLDRTTIVRNLGVLLDKGFVEDIRGDDGRESLVTLTEAGKKAIDDGFIEWKKTQEQIKSTIGLDNIQALKTIFTNIGSLQDLI